MDNGGCDNCLQSPRGQVEAYERTVKNAKNYVEEKKVSVAIFRTPEGFDFAEQPGGPICEILLYNPPASLK